jgi:hypothetical protein
VDGDRIRAFERRDPFPLDPRTNLSRHRRGRERRPMAIRVRWDAKRSVQLQRRALVRQEER